MKLITSLTILFTLFTSCSSAIVMLRNKIVIAHRGAPGYLPEHTLEGVAMAHGWQVDYIEPERA